MARRLRVHLRSPFALVPCRCFSICSVTPPAMAGLVLIASMHVLAPLVRLSVRAVRRA